jgi:hypothetical protein
VLSVTAISVSGGIRASHRLEISSIRNVAYWPRAEPACPLFHRYRAKPDMTHIAQSGREWPQADSGKLRYACGREQDTGGPICSRVTAPFYGCGPDKFISRSARNTLP